jgi:ectoine hydroxylase-related dioxygenase (phytanoyl-CoA dioxygenase family)
MPLTQVQIEAYRANGVLAPIRIHDAAGAANVRAQFDALEATEGRETAQIGLLDRHFDQRFIRELATHPKILDCAEALLGPDILLLATHFFCKYGDGERFVAWHQDAAYWGLEPPVTLTAWYAVDDSDRENGCMQALPGTHRDGRREHGKATTAGNLLSINQEVPVTEEELRSAVDLQLRAGEISLHDGWLIHGSLPNHSNRRRCGLTLRYVPAHVRQVNANSTGKTWRAILVRGKNREANWPGAEEFKSLFGETDRAVKE